MRKHAFILSTMTLITIWTVGGAAAVQTNLYYVDSGNFGNSAPPYTSWATAATHIQNAVDQAETDVDIAGGTFCEVIVTGGVYVVTNQLAITQPIRLRSASDDPESTAISGSYPTREHRVLHITGEAVVSGFTISNGYAYGESPTNYGGGVYMTTNALGKGGLLANCRVVQNQAISAPSGGYAQGAGIYLHYAGTVSNCLVQANKSNYGHGSGIFMEYGGKVYNSEIDANEGGTSTTTHGGLYFYYGGYATNCLVTRNVARWPSAAYLYRGGEMVGCVVSNHAGRAISTYYGGTVRNSLIAHNNGYGVHLERGGECRNSIIEHNSGSGIFTIAASLIDGCIIRYNTGGSGNGSGNGGGADLGWKTTIRNSLIYGNTATGDGGGIYAGQDPRPTIENCTVVRNQAGGKGGGYYTKVTADYPYGAESRNLIVYDNIAAETNNVYLVPQEGYDIADNDRFTYSCTTPAIPGEGNSDAEPLFRNPGSSYGVTTVAGDWRLRASSPCRDSGQNQSWMSSATDVRGFSRILPQEDGIVDMGAYENTPVPMSTLFIIR